MNPEELQRASFRGVPFLVSSAGTSGGRRLVRKRFPNSDRQVLEDLGLNPREFNVSGVLAARRNATGGEIQGYREVRNAFLAALEKRGSGALVHPFLGRFESLGVVTYNLNEDMTRLGDATIEITFAIDDTDGVPQQTGSVVGSVTTGSESVSVAAKADVVERFEVTPSSPGNFADAVAKATEVLASVTGAVEVIAIADEVVDDFADLTENYEDEIVSLMTDSDLFGKDTVVLVEQIIDLYTDVEDAFDSLTRLFGFGDDDVAILPTTAGKTERKQNRDVLTSTVQAVALSQAYLAASSFVFTTTEDVDEVSEALEAQFQKLSDAGVMGEDVEESLSLLRVTAGEFFDQQRDLRPQVITVRTTLTSTRLLAYQYYGSSDQGDTIALLNGFADAAVIEGDVKVLSA